MVDLVKIRKKAKQSKNDDIVTQDVVMQETVAPVAPPVVPPPPPAAAPAPPSVTPPAERAEARLAQFRDQVGRKREGMTARRDVVGAAEKKPEGRHLELLTFLVAGEQYGVDIDRIVQIVTPRPVTRVPNSDPSVIGIISLRGTMVTLVDIRRRLAHPPAPSTSDSRIVVIEQRGETLGFEVDRVLRVVAMAAGDVEPHPIVHSSEHSEAILGVFQQAGSLTILLDLERLLSE